MRLSPDASARTRTATTRRALAAMVVIVGSTLGLRSATAEPDPFVGQARTEMLAAHAATRVALCDLKLIGNPTPRDYRIAEELLATASALIPNDQTVLRLYMEAAAGADDTAALREIARRLVKLDPDDTVSLLRVVSARISDLQTADERLAAYDKFVSEESFDGSVRSRLALDAALLARERGDLRGFADRLSSAIKLDPTNRDAATLALAFYSASADESEPAGRLDFMFQVLWTDPFDPAIYSSIVSELLSKGANKGALRFANMQRHIYGVQGKPIPDADEFANDLAEWYTKGADVVIRRLTDGLEKQRLHATEDRKRAQEQAVSSEAFARPEDIRLPIARERSRLICAASMLDRERASIFLSDFAASVAELTRNAADPLHRPAGLTEEQATARARDARIDLCWLRLLTGLQLDEAAKSVQELKTSGSIDGPTVARFEAWLDLRTGDARRAEATFGTLASTDPLAALGHALAAELRSDANTASVRFAQLAERQVGDFIGAFASTRYLALAGERLPLSDVAKTLEADAAGVPQSLDAMVDNPRRAMSLEVRPLRGEVIVPTDRTPVRVTIRNTSWIALAVGPDKPICTRLLFAAAVDIGSDIMPSADLAWVANMDRRLRLLPNESMDVIVWPDLGPLSFEMEWALPKQARVRWRVLQGFELSARRVYDSAPQMLSTDVPPMIRRLPARAEGVFEALQSTLQTGGPREIADVILSLKLQLVHPELGSRQLTPGDIDRLFEVIARRAAGETLQRSAKILALCLVPNQKLLVQAMRLDQAMLQETDEHVLAVALVTRPATPNDPLFTAPAVLKSPRLTALAQMVKERLEAGTVTFATQPLFVTQLVSTAPAPPKPVPDAPSAVPGPASAPPASPDSSSAPPARPSRVIVPTIVPDSNPVPIIY